MKTIISVKKTKNDMFIDLNKKLTGVDMYTAILMQINILIKGNEKDENVDLKYLDKFFRNLKADYKKHFVKED